MTVPEELRVALKAHGVDILADGSNFVDALKNWLCGSERIYCPVGSLASSNQSNVDSSNKTEDAYDNLKSRSMKREINLVATIHNGGNSDKIIAQLRRLKIFLELFLQFCNESSCIISFTLDLIPPILSIVDGLCKLTHCYRYIDQQCLPSIQLFHQLFLNISYTLRGSVSTPSSMSEYTTSNLSADGHPLYSCEYGKSYASSVGIKNLKDTEQCLRIVEANLFPAAAHMRPPRYRSSHPLVRLLQIEDFLVGIAILHTKPKEIYVAMISILTEPQLSYHLRILLLRPLAIAVYKIKTKRVRFLVQILSITLKLFVAGRSFILPQFGENKVEDGHNVEQGIGEMTERISAIQLLRSKYSKQDVTEELYNNMEIKNIIIKYDHCYSYYPSLSCEDEQEHLLSQLIMASEATKRNDKFNRHGRDYTLTGVERLAALCDFYDLLCTGCMDVQDDDDYGLGPISIVNFGFRMIFQATILLYDNYSILDNPDDKLCAHMTDISKSKDLQFPVNVWETCTSNNENVNEKNFGGLERKCNKRIEELVVYEYMKSILWRVFTGHPDINSVLDRINIINPVDEMGGGGDLEICALYVASTVYLYTVNCAVTNALPVLYYPKRYINMMMRSAYVFVSALKSPRFVISAFNLEKQSDLLKYVKHSLLNKTRNLIFACSSFFHYVYCDNVAVYSQYDFAWNPPVLFATILDILGSTPEISSSQRHILFSALKWMCSIFPITRKFDILLKSLQLTQSDTTMGALFILLKHFWWNDLQNLCKCFPCETCDSRSDVSKSRYICNDNYESKTCIRNKVNDNLRLNQDNESNADQCPHQMNGKKYLGSVLVKAMEFSLNSKFVVEESMDLLTCSLNWLKLVMLSNELSYFRNRLLNRNIKYYVYSIIKQVDIELVLLNHNKFSNNIGGCMMQQDVSACGQVKRPDSSRTIRCSDLKKNRLHLVMDVLIDVRRLIDQKIQL